MADAYDRVTSKEYVYLDGDVLYIAEDILEALADGSYPGWWNTGLFWLLRVSEREGKLTGVIDKRISFTGEEVLDHISSHYRTCVGKYALADNEKEFFPTWTSFNDPVGMDGDDLILPFIEKYENRDLYLMYNFDDDRPDFNRRIYLDNTVG